MESVVNGKVAGVEGRPVSGGRTIYDVTLSDGNTYSTWTYEVAAAAQNYAQAGQDISALVTVEKNVKDGVEYTNFKLKKIGPLGTISGGTSPQIPGAPIQGGTQVQIPMAGSNSGSGGGGRKGGWQPEDTERVTKLAAQGTAYAAIFEGLFAGAGDLSEEEYAAAVSQADELAKHLYRSARAHEAQTLQAQAEPAPLQQPEEAPIEPTATTPQEVQAQVNEAAGQPVVGVGTTKPDW